MSTNNNIPFIFSNKKSFLFILLISFFFSEFSLSFSHNLFRHLEGEQEDPTSSIINSALNEKVTNICKMGSSNLQSYFLDAKDKTTDIDVTKMSFPLEQKNTPEYIQVLLDFILNEKSLLDFIVPYGMHILPIVVCFGLALITLVGWLFCCICCGCCKCCICCCCRKTKCKVPCFFFNFIFYIVIAICALFGMTNNNNFFNAISDTACSYGQFINQVENGEKKDGRLPKWGGVTEIKNTLTNITSTISKVNQNNIVNQYQGATDEETNFDNSLILSGNAVNPSANSYPDYLFTIQKEKLNSGDSPTSVSVIFDFIRDFGPKDKEGTTLYEIQKEKDEFIKKPKMFLTEIKDNFIKALDKEKMELKIASAKNSIDELKLSLDSIYNDYSSKIIDLLETIEQKGRLPLKLGFIGIILLMIGMGTLLIFLNIFGTACCSCCKCALCPIKFFLHLFWNILTFLTILLFIAGSLFCFLGTFGKDFAEAIEIIFGEDNLIISEKPLMIQGNARTYLYTCIHGQGDFVNDLHLLEPQSGTESIQRLKELKYQINNLLEEIGYSDDTVYKLGSFDKFTSDIDNKKAFDSDIKVQDISTASSTLEYSLNDFLKKLNSYTSTSTTLGFKDLYTLTTTCADSSYQSVPLTTLTLGNHNPDSKNCIKIQDLKDIDNPGNVRYSGESSLVTGKPYSVKDAANYYIKEINTIIEKLKDATTGSVALIKKNLNNDIKILVKYRSLIKKVKDVLKDYLTEIDKLLEAFGENLIEEENSSVYDFLNCKFIGKNILIVMKYLREDLGDTLYNGGILVIFCAFCMALIIMCTILDIIIVDNSVGEKKTEEVGQDVPVNSSDEMREKNNNNK